MQGVFNEGFCDDGDGKHIIGGQDKVEVRVVDEGGDEIGRGELEASGSVVGVLIG